MKVLIRMPARLHFATSSKVWLTTRGSSPKALDRKSTRLNSSHGYISYAVFCLKKKKNDPIPVGTRTLIVRLVPSPHALRLRHADHHPLQPHPSHRLIHSCCTRRFIVTRSVDLS